MDYRRILATNLQRVRLERVVAQEQLAHDADINRTYVSKLETGVTWAGLEIIVKLAKVLGTEPDKLLIKPSGRAPRK